MLVHEQSVFESSLDPLTQTPQGGTDQKWCQHSF